MRTYLAGPIMDCTDEQMHNWREDLKSRLPKFDFVDPTRRDYRGMEHLNVEAIVEDDKADIESCEALVAYCPTPSVGTSMEVFYAKQLGMRVLVWVPISRSVSPWLAYHADVVHRGVHRVEAQLITWEYECSTLPTPAKARSN